MKLDYKKDVKFFKYNPTIIALSTCIVGYWICKTYRDERFYVGIAMLCLAIPYVMYSTIKGYKVDPIKVEISTFFISLGICFFENNFLSGIAAIFGVITGVRILIRIYRGLQNKS